MKKKLIAISLTVILLFSIIAPGLAECNHNWVYVGEYNGMYTQHKTVSSCSHSSTPHSHWRYVYVDEVIYKCSKCGAKKTDYTNYEYSDYYCDLDP
jgi:hypothetical protein